MHSTCRVQTLKVMRFLFWDIKKERDKQQTKQMLFVKFPLKSFCSKCQAASAGRNPECPTAYRRSFDIHYIIGSKRFKCLCHFVIGSERPKITTNYAQYLLIQEITSASPCVCSVRNHRWSQNVARTKRWHTKRSWLRLLSLPHLWCHLWSIIVKNPGNTDSICFIYCICPPIEHR